MQNHGFIPTKENYTEIPPTEFEEISLNLIREQFTEVQDFKLEHNLKLDGLDGNYQIDGVMTFSIAGVKYKTLIECKRYQGPIKREHIAILHDKLQSIGAHKGIFVTTSYYQAGAMEYAQKHGITLLTIGNGKINYQVRSKTPPQNALDFIEAPRYILIFQEMITSNKINVHYLNESNLLTPLFTHKNKNCERRHHAIIIPNRYH